MISRHFPTIILLLTCKKNFKSKDKDFTVKIRRLGQWIAHFSWVLLAAGEFCNWFPRNRAFFLPIMILIHIYPSPLIEPAQSTLQTSTHLSAFWWRGSKHHHTILWVGKPRNRSVRACPILISARLGKERSPSWALLCFLSHLATPTPFSQGPVGYFNAFQETALSFGCANKSIKGIDPFKGATFSFAEGSRGNVFVS